MASLRQEAELLRQQAEVEKMRRELKGLRGEKLPLDETRKVEDFFFFFFVELRGGRRYLVFGKIHEVA